MNSSSLENLPTNGFFWYDCLIFVAMFGISTAIGIYYGCCGSKQKTLSEYLWSNKEMKVIPAALSAAVGNFSALALLAVPADTYKYGAYFLLSSLSMVLVAVISLYIYLPVFFNLRLTTTYEYLEKRFDYRLKIMGSVFTVLSGVFYIAIAAYTPALALSTATGISATLISAVMCIICVFYTTIGGLKTVVCTDLFQFFIILVSLVTVCVIGVTKQGGLLSIWNVALEGGRLDIFDFDLDPTKRDSFWIYLIGRTLTWLNHGCLDQGAAQKFLTLPKFRDCVWAFIWSAVSNTLIMTFSVFIGLLLYANYSGCDPQMSQKIRRHEQLVPLYITETAAHIPSVSGLFLVALMCASLSTISSLLNAYAGVIYKDILSKLKFFKFDFSETADSKTVKVIVAVYGIICIILVSIMQHLGDLLPLCMSITAIGYGPVMGMLTLGVLFPRANAKGAFYGAIVGCVLTAFLVIPMKVYQYNNFFAFPSKSLSVSDCAISNLTTSLTNIVTKSQLPHPIFRISHFYHTPIGALITVTAGFIISYLSNRDKSVADKTLLSPACHWLLPKSRCVDERELQALTTKRSIYLDTKPAELLSTLLL